MTRRNASPATIQQLLDVAEMVNRKNPPAYCGLDTCARPRVGLNLCRAHYLQLWKWKKKQGITERQPYNFADLSHLVQPKKGIAITSKAMFCRVDRCNQNHHARGFCRIHYLDWWRAENRKKLANA